jgi:3-methyl-2-oxobutanoate hydroxymethyltransferase
MAGYLSGDTRKVTTHRLIEMKQRGEKISMLTSYDYTMAQIVDGAGIDVILVGDSASNVMAGNVTTLPITLDQMIYHGKSVVRGVKRALVVVDLPFGTYQTSEYEAVTNAIKVMKITHADALKLEGGVEIIDAVKKIIAAGIPIMGHLGLMPQSINKYGTYTVRAKDEYRSSPRQKSMISIDGQSSIRQNVKSFSPSIPWRSGMSEKWKNSNQRSISFFLLVISAQNRSFLSFT